MPQQPKKQLQTDHHGAFEAKDSAQANRGSDNARSATPCQVTKSPATTRWLGEGPHQEHWTTVARLSTPKPEKTGKPANM